MRNTQQFTILTRLKNSNNTHYISNFGSKNQSLIDALLEINPFVRHQLQSLLWTSLKIEAEELSNPLKIKLFLAFHMHQTTHSQAQITNFLSFFPLKSPECKRKWSFKEKGEAAGVPNQWCRSCHISTALEQWINRCSAHSTVQSQQQHFWSWMLIDTPLLTKFDFVDIK